MRETRTSGSEGEGAELNRLSLSRSYMAEHYRLGQAKKTFRRYLVPPVMTEP